MSGRRKNITLENLRLDRAGAKGIALGNAPDGKVVMVKGGIPGDVVTARVFRKKKRFYEAELIEIQEPSPHRVSPKCKHFGVCGGCKWQQMDYAQQLYWKQNEVEQNLKRIAGLENLPMQPILPSEEKYLYRNKMEFSFSNARWLTQNEIQSEEQIEHRNALGFHIPGMWSKVLNLDECHLQAEPSNRIRLAVHAFCTENQLEYFDLREQSGLLRTLMIRTSSTGDLMVLVQFFRNQKEEIQGLLDFLRAEFPQITSLLYAINPKGNDSIYDLDVQLHSGEEAIWEEMEGLRFRIGPKSFYQTNSAQAHELYQRARQLAGLTGEELVYDLYTGTGTIAQFISKQAKQVVGVESVPEAIAAAKANAEVNGITNCSFFCGDMKAVLNADFVAENGVPDVLITDPPRDGMHPKVVASILEIAPERIVYVSCNSATQARDLLELKKVYELVSVQPVDMFPQTHHVENIVLLQKRKNLVER